VDLQQRHGLENTQEGDRNLRKVKNTTAVQLLILRRVTSEQDNGRLDRNSDEGRKS
jgi:hypothetical protein